MNLLNEIAIVVNSCDAYDDIWRPFFCVFYDNWPDCNIPIILNTESKNFSFNGLDIRSLSLPPAEQNIHWGERLKKAICMADKKYIIMLFDDYILEGKVRIDEIQKCVTYLDENKDISAFYFINSGVKIIESPEFEDYDQVMPGSDYVLNSSPGIWRSECLLKYTGNYDTPWAWEFFGTARTYKTNDRFFTAKSYNSDTFKYQYKLGGAIHRGKWVEAIINPVLEKYNISINLCLRGMAPGKDYPHSFSWKINFLCTGYKMIGFDVLIFIKRAIYKRIDKCLKFMTK